MSEYYRNPYGGSRTYGDKKQKSLWMILVDALVWAVSAFAMVALSIVFIGRFVSPEKLWYFPLLGLVTPIIYIVLVLSMLYWIIRWKWGAVTITGIFVLIGLFHVPLYYKLDLTKQYGEPVYDRSCIKILTFNARSCRSDSNMRTADEVVTLIRSLNPDIICFQEFPLDNATRQKIVGKLNGYNTGGSHIPDRGASLECFSKYRMGNVRDIGIAGTGSAMSADLYINDDTVRIYNIHLQTTSVTAGDNEYISHGGFIADSTRDRRFAQIARRLRNNYSLRARQAETIHDDIAACGIPVIMCGDFNDVPVSYACRKASRGLDDTFSRKGRNYAHTFRGFFNALRIDYIFVSPRFETVSYEVIPTGEISDHYPVMARVKQTSKK